MAESESRPQCVDDILRLKDQPEKIGLHRVLDELIPCNVRTERELASIVWISYALFEADHRMGKGKP